MCHIAICERGQKGYLLGPQDMRTAMHHLKAGQAQQILDVLDRCPVQYSYAPISYADPCGRETPAKSVVTILTVVPASIAGEPA